MQLLLVVLLSYFVGSIPTSIIVTRWVKGIDIRSVGSGNAGGTNVARTLGWHYGALVILIDGAKGFFASTVIAPLAMTNMFSFLDLPLHNIVLAQILAGSAAVAGHVWTVFANFRGGKGVSTAAGMMLAVSPVEVLVSLLVFAIVIIVSRYVSLGSVSAAVAFPLVLIIRENVFGVRIGEYHTMLVVTLLLSVFLIYTHRANIKRLIEGREHRLERLRS
ncbi:MAG: glycerol-3-phosphate 1-O-acyltransferase PlsY [Bacteroidota bacterium]